MNLFRSEDHIRNWTKYDPETAEGILPLEALLKLFSGSFFRRRLELDYVSRNPGYLNEFLAGIKEVAQGRPFWSPGVL
jgi:hypothetical protein